MGLKKTSTTLQRQFKESMSKPQLGAKQTGKTGSYLKNFKQDRKRDKRIHEENMQAKIKRMEKGNLPKILLPSRQFPNYEQKGWRWPEVFAAFELG